MKASPEDQLILLDLQAIDTQLNRVDHRVGSLPETALILELNSQIETARRTQAEHQGQVEDSKAELSRIEADVEVVETRIARDVERLEATSSVKDVAGLETELAALRGRLSDLEDMQLVVMERIEEQEKIAGTSADEVQELETKLNEAEESKAKALSGFSGEADHLKANRAEIAAKIPGELLALYDKQRERYGVGASLLERGISSASGVKLTESDLAEIRAAAADDVLLCPDSNAILVRTAQSGL
ncbi:MAG: hypothetical protein IT192_07620 [Microbacteriaceae bacterium]|nr:hypothetical protein [Microbacteriaceae bacterium]